MCKKIAPLLCLLMILPLFSLSAQAKMIYELKWEELMPEMDEKVFQQFQEGEIERDDVIAYLDSIATEPTSELNGKTVRIPGFLVPLDFKDGMKSTELLLVYTMGACVHVPAPPPNQTIYIKYPKGIKVTSAGYTPYVLEGVLRVDDFESKLADAVYTMEVTSIKEITIN
ncbi:hypothetical protein ACH42_02565 [Endozoicomonas sp. (ex Bugula neritina AB1)]|nr:hypothetical protein ACH42_02565 [Endozoicomonas sp. (ex Bugula neritina AB1)]